MKKVGNFEKDYIHVISINGIHFMENKIAASSSHLNVINGIGFQTVYYCFGPSRKIAEHHYWARSNEMFSTAGQASLVDYLNFRTVWYH